MKIIVVIVVVGITVAIVVIVIVCTVIIVIVIVVIVIVVSVIVVILLLLYTGVCKINGVVIVANRCYTIGFSTTNNNKNTVCFTNTGMIVVIMMVVPGRSDCQHFPSGIGCQTLGNVCAEWP